MLLLFRLPVVKGWLETMRDAMVTALRMRMRMRVRMRGEGNDLKQNGETAGKTLPPIRAKEREGPGKPELHSKQGELASQP